jgi:hypothetical protein
VRPTQFYFLLFIWFSIDFWWVILHSSSYLALYVATVQEYVRVKSRAMLVIQGQEMRWHGFGSLF